MPLLNGWKEISHYLGRGVRTAQRWERLGLPVRRPRPGDRSAVVCFSEEIDDWLRSSSGRHQPGASPEESQHGFRHRLLLVDDDDRLLVTLAERLRREGYETRTARDGFEALTELRSGTPDVLISDLRMPNMSGFELLSVVRRRFPGVAVIAVSGEFTPATVPSVLCDSYIEKGPNTAFELIEAVREVLDQSPLRTQPRKLDIAPAWVPRDPNGYVVLTCVACLRSFSTKVLEIPIGKDAFETCIHCGVKIHYRIDTSVLPFVSEVPSILEQSRKLLTSSKAKIESSKKRIAALKD